MRSQGQGLMATLLMFVPLLAVPIVATFGVPWLAAKAKSEGPPIPEDPDSNFRDTGVGQSRTARHSAEDLFSPALEPPAVDLSSNAISHQPPTVPVQSPHLRNASLVVSSDEAWEDPFANLHEVKPSASPPARQTANPANSRPQKAVEGEEKPTAVQTTNEPPPSDSEAPLPREFPQSANEEETTSQVNPFSAWDSDSSPPDPSEPEVNVGANAFEDPVFEPRINRDPQQFDGSRTLFTPDNEPPSSPATPKQTAEATPSSPSPAEVEPHLPGTLEAAGDSKPLTWDVARARLKEYGITNFYLQPDPNGEVFHFRCAYSPEKNSRINRLFEAEAADPLEAVGKVLAQLESWTARESVSMN